MNLRNIRERLEASAVWLVFHFFKILPLDAASALGGWIGRTLGPRLPVTRHARHNLQQVFPQWQGTEYDAVILRMWDNLGRVAAEYPHLHKFRFGPGQHVEVVGLEHFLAVRDDGRPGLFFSAHYGNWELLGLCAVRHGMPLHLIYRAASNPRVNWIFSEGRANQGVELIPKGAAGARKAMEKLKKGEHIGMLVDQKMNDGIGVPFFGRQAMTAPALASFGLKYDAPVVPARIERLGGARFRMTFSPPIRFSASGDRHGDILTAMTEVNRILEDWIRARPDHWLWLHQRWPKQPL